VSISIDDLEGVDFALAAYREEGVWQVQEVAHSLLDDVDHLATALRRFPGDGGALGIVAVDEDFFVLMRVAGADVRLLLSDVTAADEWEIARSAVEHLGLPYPEEDDEQAPAGDLGIFADLGLSADELSGAALTQVTDVRPPEAKPPTERIENLPPAEAATKIADWLDARKLI